MRFYWEYLRGPCLGPLLFLLFVNDLTKSVTDAAQPATPQQSAQCTLNMLLVELKKLTAEKRRTRARWQRTQAPADRTTYNRISNQLKAKIRDLREKSFNEYVKNFNRFDNTLWKRIKSTKKPKLQNPPVRNSSLPAAEWARSDKDKAKLFADHLAVTFTPNDDEVDDEIARHLSNIPPNLPPIKSCKHKESPGDRYEHDVSTINHENETVESANNCTVQKLRETTPQLSTSKESFGSSEADPPLDNFKELTDWEIRERTPEPSTSKENCHSSKRKFISTFVIRPLQKVGKRKTTNKRRKKSQVLTDTPVKDQLEKALMLRTKNKTVKQRIAACMKTSITKKQVTLVESSLDESENISYHDTDDNMDLEDFTVKNENFPTITSYKTLPYFFYFSI
ncbi:hypothetical protein ILUMI_24974 [Ignelater luminosus]|uniref:Uncharacterized protein n=1 Tax=Ignelater luminosus TaxID=2038154 RepID=A0A8K0FWE1_IGNLU|nr:hypothetical protein ILUMI_24974 [Ignelater luminosus]